MDERIKKLQAEIEKYREAIEIAQGALESAERELDDLCADLVKEEEADQ